ncbi:sortase-dependent protein [Streptomyces sp. NPDC005562]|uniref:sortase-dependent protein n=1 Tax=Streptomyces sp. NPDC005562 TaxID=3154890 RepID=UPI0033A664B4
MSTERRPTFLRTAALSTLVGGALLVPAASALADAPAVGPTAARSQAPAPDSGPSQRPTEKPTAKPTQRPEQEKKPHGTSGSPKGGVAAGAQGVRDAGDPVFLAAGGGMAAAGAAGLGYAMMRRGRTGS